MEKTNACRILDKLNINYILKTADEVNNDNYLKDNSLIFKTIVTIGSDNNHYVFLVPLDSSIDLKKASKSVNVKNVELIPQKDLFPLTGYIHGGCSPVGMKKEFETVIDTYASLNEYICVSAGSIFYRLIINPNDLIKALKKAKYDDIMK